MVQTHHLPVLRHLGRPSREALLLRSVTRRLARGQLIFAAGDRTARTYFLLKGVAKLSAHTPEGNEAILRLAVPGDILGEAALVDDGPQPLAAVAATPCLLLSVGSSALRSALMTSPEAAADAAMVLAERMRSLCAASADLACGGVATRLAGRLLQVASCLGTARGDAIEIDLPLSQGDLARMSGMCRETASRTLNSFRARGLVDYEGRRLRILRPDLLSKITCAGRRPAAARGAPLSRSPRAAAHRRSRSTTAS